MATLNGVEYSGPGWSVPAELWPAAVTRTRRGGRWMAFTREQVEKYQSDGLCPYCDGTDLVNVNTYEVHEQGVHCENCGKRWVEELAVRGIVPLEDER